MINLESYMIDFANTFPPERGWGRWLRWPLRFIARDRVMTILTGPLRGRKWITGAGLHGCWLGTYELAKQKRFAQWVQPGFVVYDLGANTGFYTLLAAHLTGRQGQVYAIEPSSKNLAFLRRHIDLNALRNVICLPIAVSNRCGQARFASHADSYLGKLDERGEELVPVTTLDHLLATEQCRPPDLLKIDVEGAEYEVLQGALELLRQHRPVLFLATHGAEVHYECCRFLQQHQYDLHPLDQVSMTNAREVLALPPKRVTTVMPTC